MACLAADGSLTTQAKVMLRALEAPRLLEDVARNTGLPLYRIRGSIRELTQAGLVEEVGGLFRTTAAGYDRLSAA
jgi:hypothetical protein